MSRERRWYLAIRLGLIGGFFGLVVVLGSVVTRQAGMMRAVSGDCGCAAAPTQWPLSVVIGTMVVAAAASALTASFGIAVTRRVIRHRQLCVNLRRRGRVVFNYSLKQSILVVDDQVEQAMTVGLWRPRVVMTTGMIRRLRGSEVQTVLRHEQAHARGRDPLWSLLLETVGATFGFVGSLRSVVNSAFSLRELIADAAATENYTRVSGLSGAMYKLATVTPPRALPAFSPNTDRVNKLLDRSWSLPMPWWSWRTGLVGLVVALGLFGATQLSAATAAAEPTMPPEACWLRQVMCQGSTRRIILMSPETGMSRYGW